jgi:hypothetical protein
MRALFVAATYGLSLLLAAAPARAVENLTGTWEGTMKCAGIDNGAPAKRKQAVTIEILDDGAEGVLLEIVPLAQRFIGFVVAASPKPEVGIVSAASCNFDIPGYRGDMIQGGVKTKPGSDKASVKLILLTMDEEVNAALVCKVSAKRTATAAPAIDVCTF